ncbi:MAG: response regulator transcription factor [bacterium]|nr:response regulator transcription factor [bacterium]
MVILLAEDDTEIISFLVPALENEHFTVEVASDGERAMRKASVNDYDLIILDLMLPKKDGFTICREIRDLGLKMPILMLTGRKLSDEKVRGLNLGADDYVVKPFEFSELLARIRALTRRSHQLQPDRLTAGDLVLDSQSHEVTRGNIPIKPTSKEYRILEYLLRNQGIVCTRTMINEHIWGFNYVKSNLIDVYITRLRTKVDKNFPEKKPLIQTVHGSGYKIKA